MKLSTRKMKPRGWKMQVRGRKIKMRGWKIKVQGRKMQVRGWKIKVRGWYLEPRMRKVKVRAARAIPGCFISRFQREDSGQDARAPHAGMRALRIIQWLFYFTLSVPR